MTSQSFTARRFGIVALITLGITLALLALPRAASAAEVTTAQEEITSAEQLVEFLNTAATADAPNAELTSDGVVTLLESVTVTGDYGVYFNLSEDSPITLDLGGRTLTLANGITGVSDQLEAYGAGTLTFTGDGSLAINAPAGQDLIGISLENITLNIDCDVTIQRSESSTTDKPLVYLDSGSLNLEEGGTLTQVVTDSGQSYSGSYDFVQCGYIDSSDTATVTMNGGTLNIAEGHWGACAYGAGTITINDGAINHTSAALSDGTYSDALCAFDSGELVINEGTIGPSTFVGASAGGTATMNGGNVYGMFYGEDAGSTITLNDGGVFGYAHAADNVVALAVEYGATATMNDGVLLADVSASGQGSTLTIYDGAINGRLYEADGGTIIVTTDPEEKDSAIFTYPVSPTMLSGIAASGAALDDNDNAFMAYYDSIETARQDMENTYGHEEIQICYCATTSPKAVIDFVGFAASGPEVDAELALFKNWLGEDIPAAEGAKMWAFASVVPGQTYTFTFTDENGQVIGEKTQTAAADATGILCWIDVNAPFEIQPIAETELPTITAGTYTVSVTPTDGQTAYCEFGVSSISLDLNGGYITAGDESIGVLTGLYPPAKWSLADTSAAAQRPGYKLTGWTSEPDGYVESAADGSLYAALPLFAGEEITFTAQWSPDVVMVYRLWNPYNGAHLLTADAGEVASLSAGGWVDESEVFSVYGSAYPDSTPVTRVYNPYNGDHLYSTSAAEVAELVGYGWQDEGVKFYGAPTEEFPVYRLWNSLQTGDGGLGSHLWTADKNEYNTLPQLPPVGAWQQEGTVWYAVSLP